MSLTFVQFGTNFSGSATSIAKAYTSATTQRSFLVAFVLYTGVGTLAVSDPTNGTWTIAKTFSNAGWSLGMFYIAANSGNTALTVTATTTGAANAMDIAIAEYTGQVITVVDDVQAAAVANGGNGPTVALNYTSETVIMASWSNTAVSGAGSGFTLRSPGGSTSNLLFQDGPFAGYGTETGTWGGNTTGSNGCFSMSLISTASVDQVVTFSPASGTEFTGSSQSVTLTSGNAATIYYTTDGTTPTTNSASVASGGSISVPTCLVQAIISGNSIVSRATYTRKINNVWTVDNGVVITAVSADSPGQPTVLYEAGAHVLSGTVFKMWFSTTNGICYAESTDGISWTRYVSNPVISGQRYNGKIVKNAGTYYLYTGAGPGLATAINAYTSSDGISWTLAKANALTITQGWEANWLVQLNVCTIDASGTWWAYYTSNASTYYEGLATSTDGINWTKSASNPIITVATSNFDFHKINGFYYGWDGGCPANAPSYNYCDTSRWSSPSPGGPWTQELNASIYAAISPWASGINTGAQYGDPAVIVVSGTAYQYYTVNYGTQNDGSHFQIGCATSPLGFSQLINTYEGMTNTPLPTKLSKNLVTLISDNFQRADGGLGANWTSAYSWLGYVALVVTSNSARSPSAAGALSVWNGTVTIPDDQWVQVTVGATSNTPYVGLLVRCSMTAVNTTFYDCLWHGNTGSSASLLLRKSVNGTFTTLATATTTVQTGDVITLTAIGSQLAVYLNGSFLMAVSDSAVTSGLPGLEIDPTGASTDTSITNFAAGTFSDAPAFPAPGGGDQTSVGTMAFGGTTVLGFKGDF
jgi:hypothetical protein